MIIVTGCDNSGKTSLVKHLGEKFGIPVSERYHTLPPVDGDDWGEWVKSKFELDKPFIHDRLYIDELVYGPVKRGYYTGSLEQLATIGAMMLIRQPMYIYTVPPQEVIEKGFDDRGQYPVLDDIPKLLMKFEEINHTWPVSELRDKARFDYTLDPDYRKIDLYVENYLIKRGFING